MIGSALRLGALISSRCEQLVTHHKVSKHLYQREPPVSPYAHLSRLVSTCRLTVSTIHSPHRVEYPPVLVDPDELIRKGDHVKVGVFAVVEVGVRLPDPLQHPVTNRQRLVATPELEASVHPALPEVAVHLVGLRMHKQLFNVKSLVY